MADGQNTAPQIITVGNAKGYRPDSKIHYCTGAWIYDTNGIAPTILSRDYKDPRLILERTQDENQ